MSTARLSVCALGLAFAGCATQPQDTTVVSSLEEMQIRVRLLQTELAALRRTLSERAEQQVRHDSDEVTVQQQLTALQERVAALPESLAALCPEPQPAATITAQCDASPTAERVVVSGDKLVVGEVERVWVDPPATFMEARIDAAADSSALHATDVVELERDGSKWVRFEVEVQDQAVVVERPLKRYARASSQGNGRRPVVTLRVQLGDVRESVEFALTDLSSMEQPMVLGRNFLTDVALVDVARKHVQPAFRAPD